MYLLSRSVLSLFLFPAVCYCLGFQCFQCDYDDDTCVQGKIESKPCTGSKCYTITTTDGAGTVKYSYGCANSGDTGCNEIGGSMKMCTAHCTTNLCNTVKEQNITAIEETIASDETTASVETTVKPVPPTSDPPVLVKVTEPPTTIKKADNKTVSTTSPPKPDVKTNGAVITNNKKANNTITGRGHNNASTNTFNLLVVFSSLLLAFFFL